MTFLILGVLAKFVEDDSKSEIIIKEPDVAERIGNRIVNLAQVQDRRRCLSTVLGWPGLVSRNRGDKLQSVANTRLDRPGW